MQRLELGLDQREFGYSKFALRAAVTTSPIPRPCALRAGSNSGLISAPRLPQAPQTKSGSMCGSRTCPLIGADLDVAAAMVPQNKTRVGQHLRGAPAIVQVPIPSSYRLGIVRGRASLVWAARRMPAFGAPKPL